MASSTHTPSFMGSQWVCSLAAYFSQSSSAEVHSVLIVLPCCAGVVRFGGHRIAGWSGTWSEAHYNWGHWERAPYTPGTMRSAYHVRKLHTHRLMQLQEPVDLFLSHDWPVRITRFGDSRRLFARKPYFQKEVRAVCIALRRSYCYHVF
jgi:hypothetical protein